VPKLAADPVTGDGRADRAAHDETRPRRSFVGGGQDVHDESARADPLSVTNRRGELFAPSYSPLGWQHGAACA
jgi:hypothetical protein